MRTQIVPFDLAAEMHQLWVAQAIHHRRPLNEVAAWAIKRLAEHGVKYGKRPPDLGKGLKFPKKKYQSGNKFTKEEHDLWKRLKATYPGGWAGVLTVALIELYWDHPLDPTIANVGKRAPRSQADGIEEEIAA